MLIKKLLKERLLELEEALKMCESNNNQRDYDIIIEELQLSVFFINFCELYERSKDKKVPEERESFLRLIKDINQKV